MGTSLVVKAPDVQFQLSDDTFSIKDLKTSVSDRKAAIASAITDKGVSTSPTAAFSTMAQNIRSIQSGGPSRTCSIKIVILPLSVSILYIWVQIPLIPMTHYFLYMLRAAQLKPSMQYLKIKLIFGFLEQTLIRLMFFQ